MSAAHPGFSAVAKKISGKEGVSMKRASAILAAGSRRASASARRRNPRLNRVKGYAMGGKVKGYSKGGMAKRGRSAREKNPEYETRTRDGDKEKIYNGD